MYIGNMFCRCISGIDGYDAYSIYTYVIDLYRGSAGTLPAARASDSAALYTGRLDKRQRGSRKTDFNYICNIGELCADKNICNSYSQDRIKKEW